MKNKIYTLRFRAANRDMFEAIRNGKKKVETRAATARYRECNSGDRVIFVCGKKRFERKIAKATHFKTISTMLRIYAPKDINPNVGSERELRIMYSSFPKYDEKIKKYGLVALELISKPHFLLR